MADVHDQTLRRAVLGLVVRIAEFDWVQLRGALSGQTRSGRVLVLDGEADVLDAGVARRRRPAS
jgi:hypothetical protein